MKSLLIALIISVSTESIASGELAFEIQENTDATIYNLQLRQQNAVSIIWSRKVPFVNGKKPWDWCTLHSWNINENGLLALVEYNDLFGVLLQFNSDGNLVYKISFSSWLQDIRRGVVFKLVPPDKIEMIEPTGAIINLLIRDGRISDKNGNFSKHHGPIHIGPYDTEIDFKRAVSISVPMPDPNPPVSIIGKTPEANTTLSTPSEKPSSSTPGSLIVIVIMIVAAGGLMWLLFKGQRNR